MTGDLSSRLLCETLRERAASRREDLPPIGGGLKPIGESWEQTDELLPVARFLFPLPQGVKTNDVNNIFSSSQEN